MIKIATIPIAIPMIIPIPIPRLNGGSERVLTESFIVIVSDFISELLFGSLSINSVSTDCFSFSKVISGEIFVNLAASVIDSVVDEPPNKVECVKSVYVPV